MPFRSVTVRPCSCAGGCGGLLYEAEYADGTEERFHSGLWPNRLTEHQTDQLRTAEANYRRARVVTSDNHLDLFRGLYDRAGIAEQERLDAAWQSAVDEMERQHADGDYTDDMVAEAALRITGASR